MSREMRRGFRKLVSARGSSGGVVVIAASPFGETLAQALSGGSRPVALYLIDEPEEGMGWPAIPGVRILETFDDMPTDTAFVVMGFMPHLDDAFDMLRMVDEHKPDHCVVLVPATIVEPTLATYDAEAPEDLVGYAWLGVERGVELLPGLLTSPEALRQATRMWSDVGFPASRAYGEWPVGARVFLEILREAVSMLIRGEADAEEIDAAARNELGFTMGPLETADLIGLDHLNSFWDHLRDLYGDSAAGLESALLRRMVAAGFLGRSAGRGFFLWNEHRRGRPADLGLAPLSA